MPECPDNIEELKELEKLIPLCRVTLYEQAKARIETGAAKSVSEASNQLAEETGRKPETIRKAISRQIKTGTVSQLAEIAGTDKHKPKPTVIKKPIAAEKPDHQVAVRYAKMAIADLRQIRHFHHDWKEALNLIEDWITQTREEMPGGISEKIRNGCQDVIKELKNAPDSDNWYAMNYAEKAIAELRKIELPNPGRKKAFKSVVEWIKTNMASWSG
jgi:hypothetical protein